MSNIIWHELKFCDNHNLKEELYKRGIIHPENLQRHNGTIVHFDEVFDFYICNERKWDLFIISNPDAENCYPVSFSEDGSTMKWYSNYRVVYDIAYYVSSRFPENIFEMNSKYQQHVSYLKNEEFTNRYGKEILDNICISENLEKRVNDVHKLSLPYYSEGRKFVTTYVPDENIQPVYYGNEKRFVVYFTEPQVTIYGQAGKTTVPVEHFANTVVNNLVEYGRKQRALNGTSETYEWKDDKNNSELMEIPAEIEEER